MNRFKRTIAIAMLLLQSAAPAFAGDKPLVIESGQMKQLPSSTTLQIDASGTGAASINIPHGTAPTSPTNGDCWTSTNGFFCQINGATVGLSGTNSGDQFTSVASGSILGRIAGGSGAASALTGTQTTTLLDTFTSSLKGLAPSSGGGTTNFLRADGSWAAPPGGSSITAQDEGSTLTTAATSFNFTGAGITASNSGGAVTVNVPGSAGGSITIVQQKSFIGDNGGTTTLSLASAPTAGNLLVVVGTYWASAMAPNTGWTQILRTTVGSFSGVFIEARVATSADTSSLASPVNSPSSYALTVFELSGAEPIPSMSFDWLSQVTATSYTTNVGCVKSGSAVVGMVSTEVGNTAPTSITGATIGTTLTGTTTNASPREITPFTKTAIAGGSGVTVVAAYAGSARRYTTSICFPPV